MACWGGLAWRQKGGHSWRRKWGERSLFFLKMGDLARGCSDGDGPGGEESQISLSYITHLNKPKAVEPKEGKI